MANVGIRDETPVNWEPEGHDDKRVRRFRPERFRGGGSTTRSRKDEMNPPPRVRRS
jgi:hypothetical protein